MLLSLSCGMLVVYISKLKSGIGQLQGHYRDFHRLLDEK